MARNEDVNTAIWEDTHFDELSDDAAFLYIWSFTNERCNMAGLYQCKARHIVEGRMTPARREAALAELAEGNFLFYEDGWVWVRSRVKNLNTKGEKMASSIVKAVKRVPANHPLRAAFLTEYLENHWISRWLSQADFDTPSVPLPSPMDGCRGRGRGQGRGVSSVVEVVNAEPSDAERVFNAWVDSKGSKGRAPVLDKDRRKLIERWLKVYPVEDLMAAVRGWRHSPHHRGENDQGKKYNSLKLCLRDPDRIEEFRDLELSPPADRPSKQSPGIDRANHFAERARQIGGAA